MHMRLQACLAVPSEGAVGEVDMYAKHFFERFPYRCHLLTLCDGIGGNKGSTDVGTLHQFGCFVKPCCHIIYLACGFERLAFLIHENT